MSKILWQPSQARIKNTNIYRFMGFINEKYGNHFTEYGHLYHWSIENIPEFWSSFWEFAGIKASKPYDQVIEDGTRMPGTKWFSGARLNFAENLLRFRDDQTALIFRGEDHDSTKMTYAELYDEVARVAKSLKEAGVQTGDRVAGFMPNMPVTVIAMLATASLGAVWSSCSPDFGIKGVLDRFGQIKPRVLFTANGYWFKGKNLDSLERISNILEALPSIEKVKHKIKKTIRANASPRHVPAKILAVPEIPYTLNMKKVELAVKKVIQGQEVTNKDALKNPEVLDDYANLKALQED